MLARTRLFCFLMALALHASALAGDSTWTWLGPEGGSLGPFLFSSVDPSSVLAASDNGVFRSSDGGASWDRLAVGLTDPGLSSLVRSGQRLLVGTFQHGVFRSDDGGETWAAVDLGVAGLFVTTLAVDPENDSRVFAGTSNSGIFRSINGGQTWEAVNEGITSPFILGIAVSPIDSETVYASSAQRVFRSSNGGQTWTDANFPSAPTGAIVIDRQGDPLAAGFTRLYRFQDGVWTNLFTAAPPIAGPISTIALHPDNPLEILVGARPSLLRTRDGGQTWQPIDVAKIPNLMTRGLVYHPQEPDTIFVGATAGTFISHDAGATWIESTRGVRGHSVVQIGIDPGNPLVEYGAGPGGAFKTVSRTRWTPIRRELDGGRANWVAVDSENPNLVFAGNSIGLYRSRDAGLHWELVIAGEVFALTSQPGLTFAAVSRPGGSGAPFLAILRSLNSGNTWEDVTGTVNDLVARILVSRQDPNRVWLGTPSGVLYSSQMGGAWQPLDEGLDDRNVVSLEEGADGAVLAATGSGRVFRLDDPQDPWTELTRPTSREVRDLAADPDNPDVLYAATAGDGLFTTEDGGESWTPMAGLENPYLSDVRLSRDRRRLYIAGSGGVYERALESTPDLGVSISQRSIGNPVPRGAVSFSVRLERTTGEAEPIYRYQQSLPLGLQLVGASADSGNLVTGPAFNSVTWIGGLQEAVTLEIHAELLDGTANRDLATQGVLSLNDNPGGGRSVSDDPMQPSNDDATVVSVNPSPFPTGVVALPFSLPIPNTFVGVALLNRRLTPQRVMVEGIEAGGATVQSGQLSDLDAQAQRASLTTDVVGSGQTALFYSPDADLEGFFLLGDFPLDRLDGVGGALLDSQRLFFPRVQQTADLDTYIFLFNPDPVNPAQVSIELDNLDGSARATSQIELSGHGSLWAAVSEIFPGPFASDGYLRLDSDRPLRGFELIAGDRTFETYPAQPVEFANRFWAPHAFFGGGVGTTRLRLLNTDQKEVRVTIRVFDDEAGLLEAPAISLASGQLRVVDLEELFESAETARQGWLQIDAAHVDEPVFGWPALLAGVEYQSLDGSTATALRLVSHPLNDPAFLQVAQSSNLSIFQGLASVIVGTPDPLRPFGSGTVQAFDPAGAVTAVSMLGDPGSRLASLLNQAALFGPEFRQEGGHLEVFNQRPSAVIYTIFGGPRFLAAVDAQGSALILY